MSLTAQKYMEYVPRASREIFKMFLLNIGGLYAVW